LEHIATKQFKSGLTQLYYKRKMDDTAAKAAT